MPTKVAPVSIAVTVSRSCVQGIGLWAEIECLQFLCFKHLRGTVNL